MVRFPAAMKMTQPFKGANVFMSRNLVPPEVFNALLDAIKLNGAEIFLCCDPSRNGPSDFHVIASPDHVRIFLSILTAIEYIYTAGNVLLFCCVFCRRNSRILKLRVVI